MNKDRAHQLDFHITLWSEDERAIFEAEQALQEAIAKESAQDECLYALAFILSRALASVLQRDEPDCPPAVELEISSVDINWADNDEDAQEASSAA